MSYYLISQTIVVHGWSWEKANENVLDLHAMLNRKIADKTVEVFLEMPESGVYVYSVSKNDPAYSPNTIAFLITPTGIPEIFEIASDKVANEVISQLTIVKGWNMDRAYEHRNDVIEVLRPKIENKTAEIFLEQPALGVYVYRIVDPEPGYIHCLHAYLTISTGETDIYRLAGGKFEDERTDVTL